MGTEYCHALYVANLDWKPTHARLEALRGVLRTYKLAKAKPAIPKKLPDDFHVDFGEVHGAPVVKLMGPSQYDADESTRYFQGVHLMAGSGFYVVGHDGEEDTAISGLTRSATKPKGIVWRTAIVFDCGKDLPAFAEDGGALHNQAFRRTLATTLETEIRETGWIY